MEKDIILEDLSLFLNSDTCILVSVSYICLSSHLNCLVSSTVLADCFLQKDTFNQWTQFNPLPPIVHSNGHL